MNLNKLKDFIHNFRPNVNIDFSFVKNNKKTVGVLAGTVAAIIAIIAVCPTKDMSEEAMAAMFQTAGATNSIDANERAIQDQLSVVSMSANEATVMTATTMEAVSAEATVVTPEVVEPSHTQLVGFSNPGFTNAESYVNIRKEPGETAKIVGKLRKNQACEVLSQTQDGWYEVASGEVYGYVKAEYLITGDAAWEIAERVKYCYVRVITETLYVRENPSTDSKVVALVSIDQKCNIVEMQDEWVKVLIDDAYIGYLNKSYIAIEYSLPKAEVVKEEVKKTESSSKNKSGSSKSSSKSSGSSNRSYSKTGSSVVSYATQFVGNPYVYGGTSLTNGADCSGFTMGVYKKFGIYLPHSSAAQASCGTKVSINDLQPGDLMFYGSGSHINHVAIYMGGGKIVHASTRKTGIKTSNAFYRTPITIRRVL